jgi:RNA polymerase sigma-70 factor (ECF subfamily)
VTPETVARAAAEAAARDGYGRLLAFLAARTRDIAAAEDALASAFAAALETWPRVGVPDNPAAWLLIVARRALGHGARRAGLAARAEPTLALLHDERAAMERDEIPDERLKLMFICAHPAIDAGARAPLMLQTVLGLDAARIAAAFLTAPAAMGQRLVRAKAKIRDAGIAFAVPAAADLPARLDAVLDAIYAAYGSAWDDGDSAGRDLAAEALWLGRLVVHLLPDAAEARGLLALMLHCEARQAARRDAAGAFVPLADQDPARWHRARILEAESELRQAARLGTLGRFQLEAAIQSVHAQRGVTGRTEWQPLMRLYDGLVSLSPVIGALVGRAATYGEGEGPDAGLALLDELPDSAIATYQPYWAVRAHLLARAGRGDDSKAAYATAIGLTEDPAIRAFLRRRMVGL